MADGNIYFKHSIHVQSESGTDVVVDGSARVPRDLSSEVNWWKLRPVRQIPAREVDENGTPYRLCSSGHYRPVRGFDKNTARPDGLQAYCKQCRHELYLRQSAEAAELAGKALHRYREKKARENLRQGD